MSLSPTLDCKRKFFEACLDGNDEEVRNLFAKGAQVNWRDDLDSYWNQETGLHYAAGGNHGDLVDLLLAQPGVDVNMQTKQDEVTPLMIACSRGFEEITRKLSKFPGIILSRRCSVGNTALHYAVEKNFAGCVELLRDSPKADETLDWTRENDYGETPMTKAVDKNSLESLSIILELPHSVMGNLSSSENYRVVWSCVSPSPPQVLDRDRCLEMLTEDPRVNFNIKHDDTGDTPLHHCLNEGRVEMAKILIKNPRVDLNVKNNAGDFPETIARRNNMVDILSELWTCTTCQHRMIPEESLITRQTARETGLVPSLVRQSRDAVMLRLTSNNSRERLVEPLVEKLVRQGEQRNYPVNSVKDRLLKSLSTLNSLNSSQK